MREKERANEGAAAVWGVLSLELWREGLRQAARAATQDSGGAAETTTMATAQNRRRWCWCDSRADLRAPEIGCGAHLVFFARRLLVALALDAVAVAVAHQ